MTEQEWLTCSDSTIMVEFLRGRSSQQELRLFACACCRRIWHLLSDKRSRRAVEIAELFAYGHASHQDLIAARTRTWAALPAPLVHSWSFRSAAAVASEQMFVLTDNFPAKECAANAARAVAASETQDEDFRAEPWAVVEAVEKAAQADVLRRIVGNVFKAGAARHRWPKTVVQIAEAVNGGVNGGFALHDALLEAGHPELADHFRQELDHPKTCWALLRILGKE